MNLQFTASGWEDYLYWQKQDRAVLRRINLLIREAQRTSFEGIGQPEPLKFGLSGCWSRRIDLEHRLVYRVAQETLIILQSRYHY